MSVKEKFRTIVAQEIEKSGLSLRQIATASGVSYGRLWSWLRKDTDTIRAVEAGKLAEYFGGGWMELADFAGNVGMEIKSDPRGRPRVLVELRGPLDTPFRRILNQMTYQSSESRQAFASRVKVGYRVLSDYLAGIRDVEFNAAARMAKGLGATVVLRDLIEG